MIEAFLFGMSKCHDQVSVAFLGLDLSFLDVEKELPLPLHIAPTPEEEPPLRVDASITAKGVTISPTKGAPLGEGSEEMLVAPTETQGTSPTVPKGAILVRSDDHAPIIIGD